MEIVVATKYKNHEWRGALIIDNKFQDALVASSLPDMIAKALGPVLSQVFQDGQEIGVNVSIQPVKPTEGARG